MARISTILPPCGYVIEGVASIQLLDWEDFRAFAFFNSDLYANCKVIGINRVASFTSLPAANAKYSSSQSGKLEIHTLETFVSELSAESLANLTLAKKRRYVPVFQLNNGKYYTYGYEAGASVSYTNQSSDAIGSMVAISAASIYPLFEVTAEALTSYYGAEFVPDFINGAFCEII